MNRSIPIVVIGLIAVNVAIHLAVLFYHDANWQEVQEKYLRLHKVDTFGLHENHGRSTDREFNVVQPLGSSFAHSPTGLFHIVLNMMCLFFFGPALEKHMGSLRFLGLYLFSAIVGGFLGAYFDPSGNPSLGASGAICGLLVAFAWLFPQSRMGLMFIPVYIPSRIFTGIFAAISAGLVVHSISTGKSLGNISHFGHLAGMVAGFIFMIGYLAITKNHQVTEPIDG